MNFAAILVYVVAFSGLALWIALKSLRLKLRQPPPNFMEVVALAYKSRAPLPQAVRTSPLRRQLILSSNRPAELTNLLQMDTKTLKVDVKAPKKPLIYGFLHPNAAAAGGGERVLWAAVHDVINSSDDAVAAIYVSKDSGATQASLVASAAERFNIHYTPQQTNRIVVIALTQTWLIDPETFPVLTMLGQAIGMAVLGYEAISNLMPDVFVDATGLAFSYPIVSFFAKVPIVAYVHYPFIQDEMISAIDTAKSKGFISKIKLTLKKVYYKVLTVMYKFAGSYATTVTCNSSWTKKYLNWTQESTVVYPPCATQDFPAPAAPGIASEISQQVGEKASAIKERSPAAVYLAQFRAEKRHDLVITSFAKFLKAYKASSQPNKTKPHLILIGSVRNELDQLRVQQLNALALDSGLRDSDYTIVQNAPWSAVQKILASSLIGINAMWNEHFGMGVVEVMAAGLIPIVNASAGPFMDIVKDVDPTKPAPGFFFKSSKDPDGQQGYPTLSEAFSSAFQLTASEKQEMSYRDYLSAQRFSDAVFAEAWGAQMRLATAEVPQYVKKRKALKLYD